ncbi:hypothetical protein [Streptomyces sp. NPDC001389]|uniref:hypothetical protein n=1 Tax=Streptomyces sp. NPDC001389 TaxID=3364569 RepID=UPI00368D5E00
MTTTTDTITPVELDGLTGLGTDPDGTEHWHRHMRHWTAANPGASEDEYQREGLRLLALNDVLRRYNTLRYRLVEEQVARDERDKALQLVEDLWQRLGDPQATGNWLHTHQAYVRALDDVQITIDMWKERALAAQKIAFVTDGVGYRDEAYRRILAAGHPPVEPLTTDPATTADQLLADHHQAVEYRGRLLAQTLDLVAAAVAS